MPSAQLEWPWPNLSMKVWAIFFAPPLSSRIWPNIEPRPMSSAMFWSVMPTPLVTVLATRSSGMPAPMPMKIAETIIESTGWSLNLMIRASSRTMPMIAETTSRVGSAMKVVSAISSPIHQTFSISMKTIRVLQFV